MAQKKGHEVSAWLARPDRTSSLVLCYGPDRGLVAERARLFAERTGIPIHDPFSTVRIDADALAEPGRLAEEASAIALFSARRLLWVRSALAQRGLVADLKLLCAEPPVDAIVLIEAGDLKKGAPLRATIEGCDRGMALPCFADEAAGLDGLIDEQLQRGSQSMDFETRQALRSLLGGDRLASRSELEKLSTYALGRKEISLDDVRAVIGDVSGASFDDAVDAMLAGRPADFDASFTRQCRSGAAPFLALAGALRMLTTLHSMRGVMEAEGRGAAVLVAAARPPIFFTRRNLVERALKAWTTADLQRFLARLQAAILESRKRPDLAEPVARAALLGICLHAAQAAR